MASKRNGSGIIEYVHPDGDVTFRIQYRDADRKQVKETLGRRSQGWTRTMAKAERQKRTGKVADGYTRPEAVKFSTYADLWFERRQAYKSYAPGSIRQYRTALARLKAEFGTTNLRDLSSFSVNNYTTRLLAEGNGGSLINRILTVLGMILDSAVTDRLIEPDKKPKPTRPAIPDYTPRALSSAEARSIESELAKESDPQIRLAFLTFEFLGMRLCELTGLKWRDLSFDESRLRIVTSKTKKGERSLHVPAFLLNELKAHHARTNYSSPENRIFCHPDKGSIWRADRGYYTAVHAACEKIGIHEKFRPAHDLRVTSLTEGAKAGVSPVILMQLAGHEDYATTKRYLDLAGVTFEDEAEKIAERRLGTLRVIEGGRAEGGSFVQEATS